ncbi:calcium-binding protein [Leisingera sp. ANG-Vp]|uniref:calcium-binding protein n=1 Tax=Leisingera sp. ANG-Vp TaxID=1577896 RepID=UPI00069165AB|nr:calcium-binding protein [Leisingera sp. ANG-Vp]
MELLLLLSIAAAGSAAVMLDDSDDPATTAPEEPTEPEEPVERDAPQELTGESFLDETLTGGTGNDTLTGNWNDNDVLLGGDGDDHLLLDHKNTGTGGEGADLFSVNGRSVPDDDEEPIRITDFDPSQDQLILENFDVEMQVQTLPEEDGLGIYTRSGELVLALPGVTELPEGAVLFEGELQNQFTGLVFEAAWPGGSDITVEEPQDGAPYGMVIADGGDNTISVSSDASIIRGGAGDDVITVTGDGETALQDPEIFRVSSLYEAQDHLFPYRTQVSHHNLFGGDGNDTISVSAPDSYAYVRTSDDDGADLVQLDSAATVQVEAGSGDTVIATEGVDELHAYFTGDGGVLVGGAADVSAWAVGGHTLNGGDGDDLLVGGDGAQHLSGGAGSDYLHGNDNSYHTNHSASAGMYMNRFQDTLDGGDGDDRILASNGDIVTGGAGTDTISAYVDPESSLGGAIVTDFEPAAESVEVVLGGGETLPEDSVPHGPSYDLQGRVSLSESGGGTSVLVDGQEVLRLAGQTGLTAGFLHTSEDGSETWFDLDGNEVSKNDLHIQLSVFHNYRG